MRLAQTHHDCVAVVDHVRALVLVRRAHRLFSPDRVLDLVLDLVRARVLVLGVALVLVQVVARVLVQSWSNRGVSAVAAVAAVDVATQVRVVEHEPAPLVCVLELRSVLGHDQVLHVDDAATDAGPDEGVEAVTEWVRTVANPSRRGDGTLHGGSLTRRFEDKSRDLASNAVCHVQLMPV